MFGERSSNGLPLDGRRTFSCNSRSPSERHPPCLLTQRLSFQEVVEKNLRHTQDAKRKRRADDGESADNDSILSTSSNLEPFANDDLGEGARHVGPWSTWRCSMHASRESFSSALPCMTCHGSPAWRFSTWSAHGAFPLHERDKRQRPTSTWVQVYWQESLPSGEHLMDQLGAITLCRT